MSLSEIAALLGLNLALMLAVMAGLWLLSLRLGDVSFIDGVWPLGMLLMAIVTFPRVDGDAIRKGLLVWLCAVWAIGLGWRLLQRWRRTGPTRRYAEIVQTQARAQGWGVAKTSLLFIFLPQGVLGWLTCLPVQLGQVAYLPPIGWLGWTGATIVVVGIAVESVGDAQLSAFKSEPANEGKVLDAGLWRYSRRPNYFGDACVWWGLFFIAAETGWVGIASIVGPLFLTYVLTRWSRITPASEAKAGYRDYAARTSAFIPWPPKKV